MVRSLEKGVHRFVLANLAGEIPAKMLLFVSSILLARLLGVEGFGVWSAAIAWFSYLLIFVDFGASVIGVSAIAKDREACRGVMFAVERLRIYIASGLVLFVLIAYLIFGNDILYLMLVLSVGLYPFALNRDWVARAVGAVHISSFGSLIFGLIFVILLIVIDSDSPPVVGIIRTVVTIIAAFVVSMLLNRTLNNLKRIDNEYSIARHAKSAAPLVCGILLAKVYYNSDIIIIESIKGPESAGAYAAVFILYNAVLIIRGVVASSLLPSIASLTGDSSKFAKLVKRSTSIGFPVGVFAALFLAVIGPHLVSTFLGEEYVFADISLVLIFLSISVLILCTGIAFPIALHALGGSKQYLICTFWAALVNIVGNILLIDKYGLPAAAGTTMAAELVAIFMTYIFYRKWLKRNGANRRSS